LDVIMCVQTRVTVLAVRKGMFHPIARVADSSFCGTRLDEGVVDYLVQEFKKYATTATPRTCHHHHHCAGSPRLTWRGSEGR
jgi:molecular chaperone DnaK (HSP70)